MTIAQKLVWAEGIALSQQHFQHWERYQEQQRYFWINNTISNLWGVCQLVIDKELLQTGQLSINQCQIIFPHGLMVHYDAATDPPLTLQLKQSTQQHIDIYFCMPLGNAITDVSGYAQVATLSAWHADYQVLTDIYDSQREYEVLFARPHLVLLEGETARDQYHAIKIAELICTGADRFQLNDDYIPPLINLSASQSLQRHGKYILELCHSKFHFLSESMRQMIHENDQDIFKQVLLLQQLKEASSMLCHYYHVATIHPQHLYQLYITIISRLCVFSLEHHTIELPHYNHHSLTELFKELNHTIRELLEIAMPAQMTTLSLQRITKHLYAVANMDALWLEKNSFYLAVKFESADPQWMSQWIRQTKVGARDSIQTIVASALSGVKIQYAHRLPNKLVIKAGYEYFYIEPNGEFWQKIIAEASLAIFIADDFMDAVVELVMVRP